MPPLVLQDDRVVVARPADGHDGPITESGHSKEAQSTRGGEEAPVRAIPVLGETSTDSDSYRPDVVSGDRCCRPKTES